MHSEVNKLRKPAVTIFSMNGVNNRGLQLVWEEKNDQKMLHLELRPSYVLTIIVLEVHVLVTYSTFPRVTADMLKLQIKQIIIH